MINNYIKLDCCFVLGIDCNKFIVSLPSTFYDDAPNKFYRTGTQIFIFD